ncbi:hypothetical protein D9757_007560 [Collybiopsis confluens]|uniref:Uncharacterized protein n=1 Tax=Collybiopsis confluens TaxID=2823264 RepID=A0A8H5M5T0_9AGAR|nr:hypothetical protein D9757_007560 [Collybiopsis confluens]
MWRKIFKHGEQDTTSLSTSTSQGEVIGKVLEQHPNLSMFRSGPQESAQPSPPSPPPSPSKSRHFFKRASRMPMRDDDEGRSPSPSPGPPKLTLGIPKKVKSSLSLVGNQSQSSIGRTSGRDLLSSASADRRPSLDLLRSPSSPNPFDSVRSSPPEFNQRPSVDTLRTLNADHDDIRPLTPSGFPQGSVRSILRDPNTPGTGRNVRFFSRTLYQDPTPDQSVDNEYQPPHSPPISGTESHRTGSLSEVVFRPSSSPKNARPTVAQVFSPLRQEADREEPQHEQDISNLLNLSQDVQLPHLPPGLDFDLELDKVLDLPLSDDDNVRELGNVMTSTPYRGSLKVKGKQRESDDSLQAPSLSKLDDGIFHSREKSPKLHSTLHDRSHSFSFGGSTAFFSMADTSNRSSTSSVVPSLTSTDTKSSPSPISPKSTDSPSNSSLRGRSRALSDTVFHSMLRSSPAAPKHPEADINDESSSDLMLYDPVVKPEPDPFSATANTYYTPQTMIPVTPPRGTSGHVRNTSREDSVIVSLQTQLALQTELCGQYEADLRARDEMVQILNQKMGDFEKDDMRRRGLLKAWKKRVQELEKQCRFLEDEVEGSRQESMERSIMDEASGEALRMLHRQIAGLERERGDMSRREESLREEVQTLESLMQERSEEIMSLKETVWSRDESQRALQKGLQEAQEQIEQIGNTSTVTTMDLVEGEDREEERERHQLAEAEWEKQRLEMVMAMEKTKAENVALEGEAEKLRQQLKTNEDELTMLKNELEAQWGHTEKANEKIEVLEEKKGELEKERQNLQAELEQLQERLGSVERADRKYGCEWDESENRRSELEEDKRLLEDEMRQANEDLQQQLQSAKDQIRYKHEHAERIAQNMKERETRIAELEIERQYTVDETSRLQSNLEQRDAEIARYSSRAVEQEQEIENLQERLSKINREHAHALGEQERALQAATEHDDETTGQLKDLLKRQGEQNVEIHESKDKITNLQGEVDRLRRQVHTLQQDSADKEVKIVEMTKKHNVAREDLSQMNMALDSKQQELELIKRKHQVRGTAGSISVANTPTAARRRDSTIFSTPSTSRPSSTLSNSSDKETPSTVMTKELKLSSENITSSKPNTLAKSTRINGSMAPPSTIKPRLSSVGHPPSRMSIGTPTPIGRVASLTKSFSAKPTVSNSNSTSTSSASTPSFSRPGSVTAHHRRTSAMSGGSTSSISSSSGMKSAPSAPIVTPTKEASNAALDELQEDEKENWNTDSTPASTRADKRRTMIPTPA